MIMVKQTAGYHARVLRVIGQDLADLIPENMTIEPDGDNVVVHGRCSKSRLEDQEANKSRSGVRRIGAKLAEVVLRPARGPELDFVPFSRTYSRTDIDQFDQQASRRRTKAAGIPDIYTLGERLRSIGKVIDSHHGRLVKIFKDQHHIVFDYVDGAGNSRKQQFDNTELYQLQTGYASERSDLPSSELE